MWELLQIWVSNYKMNLLQVIVNLLEITELIIWPYAVKGLPLEMQTANCWSNC
jgi:hypothetical protein